MIYPAPKPAPSGGKRAPKGLKRTRMKSRNAKRKGSAFPEQRDGDFTRWLTTEHPCMLRGSTIRAPFSVHDYTLPHYGYIHECWSSLDRPPIDPAHVGKHRAKGAPDLGATVPLCHAAHAFYDEHRSDWKRVTRWTADAMKGAAEDYAREYAASGLRAGTDPQWRFIQHLRDEGSFPPSAPENFVVNKVLGGIASALEDTARDAGYDMENPERP